VDRLVRSGVLFRETFAPRGQTWPSLTSVLTSTYPITHGVRTNGTLLDATHESFPEYLAGLGYTTAAFLANMGRAAHRGYDELFVGEGEGRNQFELDRDLADRAIRFLTERANPTGGDRPFFLWVHFMNPHGPYLPPPPFDRFHDGPPGRFRSSRKNLHRIALEKIPLEPADLASMQADYDGDVLAADACVGRVLRALADLGFDENTVVVFFSDHGEELYQRNYYFMHSCSVYDSVLHVPLVFRLPGVLPAGRLVEGIAELVDIVPTAARLAGLPPPPWAQGRDLGPMIGGGPGRPFTIAEWSPPMEPTERTREILGERRGVEAIRAAQELDIDRSNLGKGELVDDVGVAIDPNRSRIFTIRTERYRYVHNPDGETPNDGAFAWETDSGYPVAKAEIYDHRVDPAELTNRLDEASIAVPELRSQLEAWLAEKRLTEGKTTITTDPETLDELRKLGYLAPSSDSRPTRKGGASRATGAGEGKGSEDDAKQDEPAEGHGGR